MAYATYIATDSLAPFHVLNAQYTLSFKVQRADRNNRILKHEQRSLSGVKETLFFGNTYTWSVTLEPVAAELIPWYDEFFASTADGQSFVLDPYALTEESPVLPLSVDREDSGHTMRRVTITGDPMNSDMFEFSFEVSVR